MPEYIIITTVTWLTTIFLNTWVDTLYFHENSNFSTMAQCFQIVAKTLKKSWIFLDYEQLDFLQINFIQRHLNLKNDKSDMMDLHSKQTLVIWRSEKRLYIWTVEFSNKLENRLSPCNNIVFTGVEKLRDAIMAILWKKSFLINLLNFLVIFRFKE
jgi:hypothetical protein